MDTMYICIKEPLERANGSTCNLQPNWSTCDLFKLINIDQNQNYLKTCPPPQVKQKPWGWMSWVCRVHFLSCSFVLVQLGRQEICCKRSMYCAYFMAHKLWLFWVGKSFIFFSQSPAPVKFWVGLGMKAIIVTWVNTEERKAWLRSATHRIRS